MIDFGDKRIDLRISYICPPPTLEPVEPAALLGADNGFYAPNPRRWDEKTSFSAVYKIQNVAGNFTLNGDNNNTDPISSVYKSLVPSDFYCPKMNSGGG
ncbi:hypothetical protein PNOK_0248600 [Pyrrhoderma noxium]|uniref:Uncharacterized protein n=1 Tax=Pyrrhoderma noxium TaxID=2282107 RepID=A0A286USI4_9AGAM|nr:hypothetical protein PNOK_0248600 [Pyrrhoderma noxium]